MITAISKHRAWCQSYGHLTRSATIHPSLFHVAQKVPKQRLAHPKLCYPSKFSPRSCNTTDAGICVTSTHSGTVITLSIIFPKPPTISKKTPLISATNPTPPQLDTHTKHEPAPHRPRPQTHGCSRPRHHRLPRHHRPGNFDRMDAQVGLGPISAPGDSFNINEYKIVRGRGRVAFEASMDSPARVTACSTKRRSGIWPTGWRRVRRKRGIALCSDRRRRCGVPEIGVWVDVQREPRDEVV